MTDPTWAGFHHLTLNVHDVGASEQWYSEVLGFTRFTTVTTDTFERVIVRHESGLALGLNRHSAPEADEAFSERRTGLDHIALCVADRGALEEWADRFTELAIDHSEIKAGGAPGSWLIAFRDPDNIQLELFAPPPA